MSVLDSQRKITPEHQSKLDGLADALTETVMLRLLGDPTFIDRILEAIHFRDRPGDLRIREELIHLVRAIEEAKGLPRSIPAKRDVAA